MARLGKPTQRDDEMTQVAVEALDIVGLRRHGHLGAHGAGSTAASRACP